MAHEPTRAIAIGVAVFAIVLLICGVIPDQPRAQARTPAQIIQTATPQLPTMPAPVLAAQEVAPAPIVSVPVSFDLAPVSASENAAQEAAPPITIAQPAPQFVPEAPLDAPNAVPQCAPGVDNPTCDLPVLVLSNDAPATAPIITERDRAYSRARTR